MIEPLLRSGTPVAAADSEYSDHMHSYPNTFTKQPQYIPYRPTANEYTPPASPQPLNSHPVSKSFGLLRSRHPANLQMDTAPASYATYERPMYSPSPTSSPPLPPSVPSPHFVPRQRAPSLLRHAATSSPLNRGFPRAEHPLASPTFVPMTRRGSGPGAPNDARVIFNPLASNPVNQTGPSWTAPPREEMPGITRQRSRGYTSTSQQDFVPHLPLRSATSIPDYAQYRASSDRPNPSGAYRPNRGGANWSHNDHFPMPPFRPAESRASFRSAWTNASTFVDGSGTERSSMATRRSSISETRMSVSSVELAGERDLTRDSTLDCEAESFEDDIMSVEDLIDSYCYDDDEDEEVSMLDTTEDMSRLSASLVGVSDSETPGLSQTHSQSDRGNSPITPDRYAPHDTTQQPDGMSYLQFRDVEYDQQDVQMYERNSLNQQKPQSPRSEYLPPLSLSPVNYQYSSTAVMTPVEELNHITPTQEQPSAAAIPQRQPFDEIRRDLNDLPELPKNMSRISRQDWGQIHAYSRKNSRGSVNLLEQFNASSPNASSQRPTLVLHTPNKESTSLPKADEDDAYPRRASTSVFDRRSTLFELNKAINSAGPPTSHQGSRSQEFKNGNHPTGKRQSGQTIANSPVSPLSPTFSMHADPRFGRQTTATIPERDQYGFKKATDKISPAQYDAWYSMYEPHVTRRRGKWVALMEKNNLSTIDPVKFPPHSEKVRRYARKGYPPEWRGAMWWYYANGQKKLDQMRGLYPSLVARVRQGELNRDDKEAIERDLDRTFPDNIHFRPDPTPENPEGNPVEEPSIFQDLREVLQCFALNNPNIGYCQSLNFIAGLLLLFLKQDNEKVFVLLTIITQHHLPGAHARNLANTEVNVLMMLIKEYLPKVWASINDTDIINNGLGSHAHPESKFTRQPTVALSCTSWFMSLFVGVLPIEVVLRVWDSFLYEGPRALFRYALAIFKLGEPEIRKFHPGDGELFMTVQNLPRMCLDPNILHEIAYVKKGFGSLSQNVIDQKRQFWQQQTSKEKAPREKMGILRRREPDGVNDDGKKLRRKPSRRRFFKKEKDMST